MEIDVLEEQNADVSLIFLGGKMQNRGALSLLRASDVIGRSFFFVCFFSFFLDRSIDRERSISCKKNREAIDVMDSF